MKSLLLYPIRFYRKYISPYTRPRCKFYPTCSEYAIAVITEWGVILGTSLAVWRILRCNPLSRGGIDMPPKRTK